MRPRRGAPALPALAGKQPPRELTRMRYIPLMPFRPLTAGLLLLAASACSTQKPLFHADGYHNNLYSYRVQYASGAELVGPEWTLENFQLDDAGKPKATKVGPDYRYTLEADIDGDGKLEKSEEMDLVDLRLVHKRTAGRIWLTSMPLSQTLADTDLSVLAKHLVNAVAGTGLRIERISDALNVRQQTYATRVLQEEPVRVDGAPAHRITFEMASVDQLKLDPNSRWQRISAVLMRPGFLWGPADAKDTARLFPVLLIAGYVAQPDQFDAGVSDFDAFVRRIDFQPADVATLEGKVLACAGERKLIRILVIRDDNLRVLSPDLGGDQTDCAKDVLAEHSWDFTVRKSFIFRKPGAASPK